MKTYIAFAVALIGALSGAAANPLAERFAYSLPRST